MIYLVTSSNAPYLNKIRPFLQQLNALLNRSIQPVLVCVDCDPPKWLATLPRICAVEMTAAQNEGTSESTSVEHGSFLALLPGGNDDLFLKVDGDLVMQRPFDEAEMEFLHNFPPDAVGAAWNAGEGDNLLSESVRILPMVDGVSLARRFPLYEHVPCGNGGVWIARRGAYKRLYDRYMQLWPAACESFAHYARQQWLVNYARYAAGLEWLELSPAIHAHGHYGIPAGVTFENGTAYYNERPVVFRHKL